MAYKFQRGEAILSGALVQEGNIEIESGFEFAMHDVTVLDTSRNLTVAGLSGSGKLEVGGTVQLDGVEVTGAVATDKMYFLDSDGFMKADAIEDVRDFLIFDSVSGDATIAHGGALTIAAGAVENSMLSGGIANDKLVNDSVTVTAGAALTGGGEVDLGASINLDVAVDDSSIEVSSDALQVKALGITNDMLAGSIASSKIAELNNFDTDNLSEGASNLYFTDERVDDRVAALVVGGDAVSATYDDAAGSLTLAAQVDDSSIEVSGDALQVKALGITNDMLSGSIASSKIAELNAFDTADLAEGSNLYFTDARARAAVSVTDAGGDGSLAYDSSTGVITYTGPSAAEVRAHLSVADSTSIDMSLTDGEFSAVAKVDDLSIEIDAAEGLRVKALGIENSMLSGAISSDKLAELNSFDTGDLAEGSNLYYTEARWDTKMAAADTGDLAEGSNLYFTDARARAAVSVTDAGGDGSLAYDSGSGVFTYTGPSASEVRAHFSGGEMIDLHGDGDIAINAGEFSGSWDAVLATKDTADLAEGSNLYFTEARARASLSIVDAGGDGSFAYNSTTGVFTYTGPSADEVRAHLSVLDTNSIDMSVTDGQFSAALLLSGSSLEVTADGLRIAAAAAGPGLAWTDGVLSVQGNDVQLHESNGTLVEGYNYVGDLTGPAQSMTLTLPDAPSVGDVIHVKAANLAEDGNGDPAEILIEIDSVDASGHRIDGETYIVLESPYAAVSLVYVASNDWRIV
jgi:hypothetical protein